MKRSDIMLKAEATSGRSTVRRGHRCSGLVLLALVGIGVASSLPAPAEAYVRDFEVVSAQSPADGSSPKAFAIGCPAGKVQIGHGGSAQAALGPLVLTANRGLALNRLAGTVGAIEINQIPAFSRWSMTRQARCVTETPTLTLASTRNSYLKDVSYHRTSGPTDLAPSKTVRARCPLGKTPIGGGFSSGYVEYGEGFAVRTANIEGYAFRVTAHKTRAGGGPWLLGALVICANITSGPSSEDDAPYVGTITHLTGSSELGSHRSRGAAARCPAGQRIIGGSVEVLGRGNQPPPAGVVIHAAYEEDGWEAQAEEDDPTTAEWRLQVEGICATFVSP
jgi:hypothetical protein